MLRQHNGFFSFPDILYIFYKDESLGLGYVQFQLNKITFNKYTTYYFFAKHF